MQTDHHRDVDHDGTVPGRAWCRPGLRRLTSGGRSEAGTIYCPAETTFIATSACYYFSPSVS